IVTYPVANTAMITAMTMNAAGMPVSPVVAYAAGITPAATVSGATPARTKNKTAGTPSLSRASARDTVPALARTCMPDIKHTSGYWGFEGLTGVEELTGLSGVERAGRSGAVRQHGAVGRRLRLGDQVPQLRVEPGGT